MDKEKLKHYLKGGKFIAIYNPKSMDISWKSQFFISQKVIIYQNIIISPIITPLRYSGQHAFNCDSIYGWSPEEDFDDIEIIDVFIESPNRLPQYMYKLSYFKQEKIEPNFGKGYQCPLIVGREYDQEMDDYVMKISNPQACKIEKFVWEGEDDEINWELMYNETT